MNYHDQEWGVPVHDNLKFFESLFLECMSCGLSFLLILNKRKIFAALFDEFNYRKICDYDATKIEKILSEPKMIHSRSKIEGMVNNAKCFMKIVDEFGSFHNYLQTFTKGKTLVYLRDGCEPIQTFNALSEMISTDLRKRGFKFVGKIIIYSFLQACGVINDHEPDCFRYKQLVDSSESTVFIHL